MNPLSILLDEWQQRHLLTDEQREQLETHERNRPVSLYILLRSLLYLGIVLFTSGVGVLIYNNIDTIGHTALITLLAVLTAGSFFYVYRTRVPFSWGMVENEAKFSDFALLISCTLFLLLEGYVQWRYTVFGTRYGLATVLPAVLFLFCAYRFDHRGVLSMGLTALASWVGITVAPLEVLNNNDFNDIQLIVTGVLLGAFYIGVGLGSEKKNFKKHFAFTYLLLGGNVFFIGALAGLFRSESWSAGFILPIVTGSWLFMKYARRSRSFLFLLMAVVYGYIGITYLLFETMNEDLWAFFGLFYIFGSTGAVIWFFMNYKKLLKEA
ncbi:DUF2157 domain-containing protein [Runella sp.]|uniref:DUF2157 domain-containing protein n=1 Tax=Runella sp. TaxID=1960881 RepID=UPI003D0B613A